MTPDQFLCVKTLAESLDLYSSDLLSMASGIAGHRVEVITDLPVEQAHQLIDLLAALDVPRKSPQAEQPEAKKERA